MISEKIPRNKANPIQNPSYVTYDNISTLSSEKQGSTIFIQFHFQPKRELIILGLNQFGYQLINCSVPSNPPKAIAYCTFESSILCRKAWSQLKAIKELYGQSIKWSTIYDPFKAARKRIELNEKESKEKKELKTDEIESKSDEEVFKVLAIATVKVFPCIEKTHYDEASAQMFYVIENKNAQLNAMQAVLNSFELAIVEIDLYEVGALVAARWNDGQLYRAVIVKILEDFSLLIRFIDYGNMFHVNEVFYPPEDVENMKPFANYLSIDTETYRNFCEIGQTIEHLKHINHEEIDAEGGIADCLTNVILDELECKICFNHISSDQVHQCINSHVICLDCKEKAGEKCPQCKCDTSVPLRNRVLERLSQ